ncbi:MAG: hypothetical protein QM530_11115, partial [Phycisphaerales bacterium]|nr:hypothetical protein [Phycisphaerales bacterium]
LAKGYQHKYNNNSDSFLLQCANIALQYDPKNLNVLLLKAEWLENRLQTKNIAKVQSSQDFQDYQKLLAQLYHQGYREMPLEMKNNIIRLYNKEKLTNVTATNVVHPDYFQKASTPKATLSWGLFDERHTHKATERYGNTIFNTRTKKITAFATGQNLYNNYNFDPVVFAMNVDPLAHKFPSQSPYSAFGGNPIFYIDVGGAFQYPANKVASYTKSYPMITKYLAQNIQRDVLKSPAIMQGMAKYSEGNLTPAQIKNDTKWNEKTSPTISFSEGYVVSDDGKSGTFAEYTSHNNTINISKGFADRIEGVLAGDASMEDKQAALYEFFATIGHEEVHRGDYLDGIRQENSDASGWGGEPGAAFMTDVFESKDVDAGGEKMRINMGSVHGDSKQIVTEQQNSGNGNIVPTVPNK